MPGTSAARWGLDGLGGARGAMSYDNPADRQRHNQNNTVGITHSDIDLSSIQVSLLVIFLLDIEFST